MSENSSVKVILFSNVVDSSRRIFNDEHSKDILIERDNQRFKDGIKKSGGQLIKNTGDGILATFPTTNQALGFIQKLLISSSKQGDQPLQHKFGLHIGEVNEKNEEIVGQAIHIAAQLQTISPIKGVAFTQETHRNIDPRFRKLAIPLGNIRLKGLPEELSCYGIEEQAFLGRESVSPPIAQPIDNQMRLSTHHDGGLIKRFLETNKELIVKQPSRAASAFGDWIGEKSHLLPGSRDILTRPEWGNILSPEKSNSVSRTIGLTQLTEWITSTFAPTIASPWLQAIHGTKDTNTFYGQQQPDAGEPKNTSPASANAIPGIPQQATKPTWLWIGAGILTAVLAAFLMKMKSGQPPSSPPGGKGVEQGIQRNVDINQPLSGETEPIDVNRSAELPKAVNDIINYSPEGNEGQQDIGQPNSEASQGSTIEFPQNSNLWEHIREELLNGSINTNDLSLSSANGYLNHWVQEFKIRNNALSIRLRTRQAVTADICEPLLINYQRAYRQSKTAVPWVVLESSKSKEDDIIGGFLPVCQLSPQGRLETIR